MSDDNKRKKIRPRKRDMNQWTKIPNEVFDVIMKDLTGAEFKVYCAILRQTYGYKDQIIDNEVYYKTEDQISLSQFIDATGLSQSGVRKCLKELIKKEYVIKVKEAESSRGKPATYAVNQYEHTVYPPHTKQENQPLPQSNRGVSHSDRGVVQSSTPSPLQSDTPPGTQSDTTKEKELKEIKESNNNMQLDNKNINRVSSSSIKQEFKKVTGRLPSQYDLEQLLEISDDEEKIIKAIHTAGDHHKSDKGHPPNLAFIKIILENYVEGKNNGAGVKNYENADWASDIEELEKRGWNS